MKDQWSLRVPLVLLPVDDFTGNIIKSPDIHISVPQAGRPVIKPDGFWIYPKLREPLACVTLHGNHYRRQVISIDVSSLSRKYPVQAIRVLPSKAYPFPPDTICMEGNIPEGARLFAAAGSGKSAMRLRLDGNAGDEVLTVFQETRNNLDGRTYLLTTTKPDGGAKERDWVTFTSPSYYECGMYRLKSPLAHSHRKINAALYPAVTYLSDTMGTHYFIAIAAEKTETDIPLYCRLIMDNRQEESEFLIRCGETLQQNFVKD